MKICFVLPKFARKPIGGFKIAFEYANRLSKKGYDVQILFLNKDVFTTYPIPLSLKEIGSNIMTIIEPQWFELDPKVKKISGVERGMWEKISDTDVAVATAVDTVYDVKRLFTKAKKLYLIQDYEVWNFPEQEVKNTFCMGFTNIVISDWLKKIVDDCTDKSCYLIKNPVDINIYRCKISHKVRKKHSMAFLYHEGKHKGTIYALKTIEKLKVEYPDLEVYSFGTAKNPVGVPPYVKYTYCASQKKTVEIYNKVAIFLCATVAEGYGLTGLEAMACGAALVSTDYQGVHEYAKDGVNALLSPVKDVDALVVNVSKLFDDDELRYRIAEAGIQSVQKNFNWECAVDKFERVLTEQ